METSSLRLAGRRQFHEAHLVVQRHPDAIRDERVNLSLTGLPGHALPRRGVLEGEEAIRWNEKFGVEMGHHLFAFAPEKHPDGLECVVAAKSVRVSRTLEGFVRE